MRGTPLRQPSGRRLRLLALAAVPLAALAALPAAGPAAASTPAADVRLSNDAPGTSGYVSDYTAVTGQPYTDAALTECSRARGRQNEPAVAVNPRNPQVIVGSSNDYCGDYNDGADADGAPLPVGPDLAGLLPLRERRRVVPVARWSRATPATPRRTRPGPRCAPPAPATRSSPGTATAGCSPARRAPTTRPAPKKTFGDEWVATYENPAGVGGATINDGKEFRRSVIVAKRLLRAEPLGVFNDKTAIAADRTATRRPAATSTSPGPGSPATAARTSTWSAPPTTARPSPRRCC